MLKNRLGNIKGQMGQIFVAVALLTLTTIALVNWIIPGFRTLIKADDQVVAQKEGTSEEIETTYSMLGYAGEMVTGNAIINEINTIMENTYGLPQERWIFDVLGHKIDTIDKDKAYVEETKLKDEDKLKVYQILLNNTSITEVKPEYIEELDEKVFSKEVNVETSTITYGRIEKVSTMCGDVDGDYKVNESDVKRIRDHLLPKNSIPITNTQALINADVNLDGKITNVDKNIIYNYYFKQTGYEKLPYEDKVHGDLNGDNVILFDDFLILQRHIGGIIPITDSEILKRADVNLDGLVNEIDRDIIGNYCAEEPGYESLPYINKVVPSILYGDVNGDGKVNGNDRQYIINHVNGSYPIQINTQAFINADVNLDGKVDDKDRQILDDYVSHDGWKKYTLPKKN